MPSTHFDKLLAACRFVQNATRCFADATQACLPCGVPTVAPYLSSKSERSGKVVIMQITIKEDKQLNDVEVAISCPKIDEEVNRIVARLRMHDSKFFGSYEGRTYLLDGNEVLYIESLEGKTFLYAEDKVLESSLRLYEFEERLAETEFVRASRQMLVNFDKVTALKPDLHARIQLTLSNGEAVTVSRQYAPEIKKKIGIKA